jgi:trigger factor
MEDAIDIVFPPAFTKAIEELELNPVTRPDLEQIEKISEEEGATFIVKVGVKPEIVLGDYKGAEIDSLEPVIDDEKIMAELQKMQDQNSRLITLEEGEVKDGSTATIDYEGFLGDEPFVGGKDSDYDLKIGSQTFIPGFEEQLIGAKIGESLDVNVTFPEDYHAENLKGQDVVFKVAIKGIKEKELPELDDEFAKDVSEFDTLDELKEDLSKKLFETEKEQLKGKAQSDVVEFALNAAEFDVPYLMIEEEVDQTMQNFENQMSQQGLTLDDYFKYTNTNREDFRNNLKGDAEKNIRIELVLATIGEVENIAVSEEEIDEEIKVFAEAYGKDFEEYKNSIQDRMKEYIEANVKRRKTVDLLVDAAVVKA